MPNVRFGLKKNFKFVGSVCSALARLGLEEHLALAFSFSHKIPLNEYLNVVNASCKT